MPETRFKIQWPDGSEETCYSPSSIVRKYFEAERDYELADFVDRARTALTIASDRVKAKYGKPCSLAIGQLAQIQSQAIQFSSHPHPVVRTIEFLDETSTRHQARSTIRTIRSGRSEPDV